ncbi:GTPase [Brumimicrobium aurantiacum]|uniref:ATP-binding cassette domain-containing protein n=1 Tax=Brumimicrobium aurantiacum TaxID=1737063 RepID=A0A3E1EV03_9FLAO|nr:GTPase [Brumimicrobium aurantiacum]RFC53358.1 ATP-binding cassette domain-containing protein [Brumimicrobium aurantiacum]
MKPDNILKKIEKDLEEYQNTKIKCAIIGRSGTGKSSLINAIAGEEIAEVGEIETTMNIKDPFEINGLMFYDLPGCSTSKFPREQYIEKFKLSEFDSVILVTSDRFYEDDLYLIEELIKLKIPVFAVRTKIDFAVERGEKRGVSAGETCQLIYQNIEENLNGNKVNGIYLTSADYPKEYDLSKLLEDIFFSLNDFKRERFIADINITSQRILDEKRKIAEKIVMRHSALAAANGLNPVPGVDISLDIALMVKMSKEIQLIYGLNQEQQAFNIQYLDKKSAKFIATKILQYTSRYGGKEALMILLKRVGSSIATKTASKWVPFVGQAIAAGIGFKMTSWIGKDMINDAEEIAKETFEALKVSSGELP